MTETRGYQTINDRTDGWGPGVVEGDQPDADATPEVRDDRIAKTRKVRKRANVGLNPDTDDRSATSNGTFDPTAGADAGYGIDWDTSPTVGTDFDLDAETGSNTTFVAGDAEVDSSQRASKPLPTWNADGSVTPNVSYTSDPVEQAAS